MHPNPAFRPANDELCDQLVDAIGFGMVFAQTADGPRVAHTPLVRAPGGTVRFHLANANALTPHLEGTRALLLVNGPHGYVSPRWYEEGGQVPTWNYVAIELEGRASKLSAEGLADLLGAIGALNEGRLAGDSPWRPQNVAPDLWEKLFSEITGFEMAVEERRATFKLSQNKPPEERERVADALDAEGWPHIAAFMRSFAS